MYVCLCKGVTDKSLRESVRNGASTFKDVSKACNNAASQCGKCAMMARDIVRDELSKVQESTPLYYAAG